MCSKPATHPHAAANLFVPPERARPPSEGKSVTDSLLENSQFESLPWFKEVHILQLNRLLLLKDCLNAKRKLHRAQTKLEYWMDREKKLSNG